jgi:hypothetical protein
MSDRPISAVMAGIAKVAAHDGVSKVGLLTGCWERRVGDHWAFALNGHDTTTQTVAGVDVPPFEAYLTFDGWPAGFVGPFDGVLVNMFGQGEDDLIAALEEATRA